MNDRALELVHELMEELQENMRPSEDELGERLGRPKMQVMKIEAGDDDEDMPMQPPGEEDQEMEMDMDSPEDMLKKRLMKIRE